MPRPRPHNEDNGTFNPFVRACAGLTGAGNSSNANAAQSRAAAHQDLATARQRLSGSMQQQQNHQLPLHHHDYIQQQQHAAMQQQMQMQQQMLMMSPGDAAAATAAAVGASMGMTASDFGIGNSNAGMFARSAGLGHPFGSFPPGGIYSHLGAAQGLGGLGGGMTSNQQQGSQLSAMAYGMAGSGGEPPTDAQAEREEELLLNLLIARRNRNLNAMRSGEPLMSTPWTEEYILTRQGGPTASAGRAMAYGDGGMSDLQGLEGGGLAQQDSISNFQHLQHGNLTVAEGDDHGQRAAMYFSETGPAVSNRTRQRPFGADTLAAAASIHSSYAGSGLQRPDVLAIHHGATNTPVDGAAAVERLDRIDRGMLGLGALSDALMQDGDQSSFGQASTSGDAIHHGGVSGKQWAPLANADAAGNKYHKIPPQKERTTKDSKKPSKRSHKKKPRDMPRRPLSAYNLFFSEERERILREIEGVAAAEEDDDGDHKKTEGSSTIDEEGDKDEKQDSATDDGASSKKPKALLRPLLASEKKRRPHRKTHGKISFQMLAQKVGARWKALPDVRRKYYQDLAVEDMKRQKKAMEEYYHRQASGTHAAANEMTLEATTTTEAASPESSKNEVESVDLRGTTI